MAHGMRGSRVPPASFFSLKDEAFSLPLHTHDTLLKTACILVAVMIFARTAGAQETSPAQGQTAPDTSRGTSAPSYILHEVIVTTGRMPAPALATPAYTTVMARQDVAALGGTSLGSILAAGTGLFVKDYGGPSGLKTISQRGLGAEHTLVLLNGLPVNSIHNGGFDLSLLSAEDVERVEIVHGGQSALHGAHAVAGVVNVLTRTMGDNEHAVAGLTAGSFGYRQYRLAGGMGGEDVAWRLSAAREQSDEDYPFTFRNGPAVYDLRRKNADLLAHRLSGSLAAVLSPRVRLSSFAALLDAERGVPGVVTGPFSATRARQVDRSALVQTSLTATFSPVVTLESRLQGQYGYQRYRDADLVVGNVPVDNFTVSREVHGASHVTLDVLERLRLFAGGDAALIVADGNSYDASVQRTRWGLAMAAEHRVFGPADGARVVLFPAVRFDHAGPELEAWSPQLGLMATAPVTMPLFRDASVRGRAMASRNFRSPTFNEMFYSGGGGAGNPDLRPERSHGYEAGGGWSGRWMGEHHLDVTAFVVRMTDRVIWVPAPGGIVTPKNLRSVDARGFEAAYVYLAGGLRVHMTYALRKTEKISEDFPGDPNTHVQVIYVPQENAALQGSWTFDPGVPVIAAVELHASVLYVGHRFTTEDNRDFLPSHVLIGGALGLRVRAGGLSAHVRLQVENASDRSFEVMAGYPMPPRTLRLSVDVTL